MEELAMAIILAIAVSAIVSVSAYLPPRSDPSAAFLYWPNHFELAEEGRATHISTISCVPIHSADKHQPATPSIATKVANVTCR